MVTISVATEIIMDTMDNHRMMVEAVSKLSAPFVSETFNRGCETVGNEDGEDGAIGVKFAGGLFFEIFSYIFTFREVVDASSPIFERLRVDSRYIWSIRKFPNRDAFSPDTNDLRHQSHDIREALLRRD